MLKAVRGGPGTIRATRRLAKRSTRSLTAALLTTVGLSLTPAVAGASEGVVAFPGSPLSVFVGQRGECQSSYPVTGVNYYIAEDGDCGFFLAFPEDVSKSQPEFLRGQVFGFTGSAGPHLSTVYVPVEQSGVSGTGSGESPYTETTVYDVAEEEEGKVKAGGLFAKVTDRTEYVSGSPQFTSTYTVKNEASATEYFRAIYAGDLYVAGDDFGIGEFLGGPPRFIGGENTGEGILGGFIESTPWSAWEEGCWNETSVEDGDRCAGAASGDQGIWHIVRESATKETGPVFNDEADPAQIDNATGVEWDENLTTGLAAHAETSFTVINHTEAPAGLSVNPGSQTLTQGQTATVTVSAVNTAGKPYAGVTLRYTIGGANPQSGAVVLNSAGQGQISYVGNNAGIDTIQMYLDLANSQTQTETDPSGTASVTFLPKPPAPAPNSTYKIQSIKANSNGTITIVFVPTQNGTATVEVTVPTATIASTAGATAAKAKKCKKGQIRIKGKCRPKITHTGKVSATGIAGVPLKITVHPSSAVTKALKKGKTVTLTATLTYKSALGGSPTTQVLHFKVKPPKKKHKH